MVIRVVELPGLLGLYPARALFKSLKGSNVPKELSDALVSAGQDILAGVDGALNLLSPFTDNPTLSSEAAPPAPPPVPPLARVATAVRAAST